MNGRSAIERLRTPRIAFVVAIAIATLIWVALSGTGDVAWILSITVFCISLWILTPIPPAYTGLIGIGLIAVAFSTELALAGFQKPATWLIGFGLLMGEATRLSTMRGWYSTIFLILLGLPTYIHIQ